MAHFRAGVLATLLSISAIVPTASAQVTVGADDGNNCYPFSCFTSDGGSVYQQVYAASAFPGQMNFNTLTFFADDGQAGLPMDSATYAISFYLSSVAPNSLSQIPGDNLGALLGVFGTFNVGGNMPATLELTGSDISYDPIDGNLLMQVTVESVTDINGDYSSFFRADYSGVVTSRLWLASAGDGIGEGALVTQFSTVAVATPEPASIAVLMCGVAGLAALRRRRMM